MASSCPSVKVLEQLKENPKYPRNVFISPITRSQKASMTWTIISQDWRGYSNPDSLTEKEINMLKELEVLRVASGSLLCKEYYSERSLVNAKARLKKLSTNGILVCHHLITEKKGPIPVFTLGPGGAKILDIPFTPNWWEDLSAYKVLNQLTVNKLYSRLKTIANSVTYLPAPFPFYALIEVKGYNFLVSVTNKGKIPSDLYWEKDSRLIVVCETLEEIVEIALNIKNPNIRYITDYELFVIPMHEALIKYDYASSTLISTEVNLFVSSV